MINNTDTDLFGYIHMSKREERLIKFFEGIVDETVVGKIYKRLDELPDYILCELDNEIIIHMEEKSRL